MRKFSLKFAFLHILFLINQTTYTELKKAVEIHAVTYAPSFPPPSDFGTPTQNILLRHQTWTNSKHFKKLLKITMIDRTSGTINFVDIAIPGDSHLRKKIV